MKPSCSSTVKWSISRSISSRGRLTSVPSSSSGAISLSRPPTSSAVASRSDSRFSAEIIVPTPSCVNSSISTPPSSACEIRWQRATPPRQARSRSGNSAAASAASPPSAIRRSACSADSSSISAPSRSRTPSQSLMRISLSALSAIAALTATSSAVRLNASPVGEKPSGDSSTSALLASECFSASTSTLRTTPVS